LAAAWAGFDNTQGCFSGGVDLIEGRLSEALFFHGLCSGAKEAICNSGLTNAFR
jgi:hypothetical protein